MKNLCILLIDEQAMFDGTWYCPSGSVVESIIKSRGNKTELGENAETIYMLLMAGY